MGINDISLNIPSPLGWGRLLSRLDVLGLRLSLSRGSGSSRLSSGGLGLLRSLSGLSGGGGLSGLGRSLGSFSDGLLFLVLRLLLSCLLLAAQKSTKDGGALPASRPLALFSLGVLGFLLGLLLRGLGGSSRSLSRSLGGGGSLLSSLWCLLGLLVLSLLLLLGRGEGGKGGLVLLRLGDGFGELLGLGDLKLQLGDPVVALGGGGGLEGVLVPLGGQDELVGALSGRLSSVGLEFDRQTRRTD